MQNHTITLVKDPWKIRVLMKSYDQSASIHVSIAILQGCDINIALQITESRPIGSGTLYAMVEISKQHLEDTNNSSKSLQCIMWL